MQLSDRPCSIDAMLLAIFVIASPPRARHSATSSHWPRVIPPQRTSSVVSCTFPLHRPHPCVLIITVLPSSACYVESMPHPTLSAPHSTSVATRLMFVLCLYVLAPRARLPDYSLPSLLDHSCDHHCPLLVVPCCVPLAADCRSQAAFYPLLSSLSTRYAVMTG